MDTPRTDELNVRLLTRAARKELSLATAGMSSQLLESDTQKVRYFITFACYGAHLHGAEFGSVDRDHNLYGGPLVDRNPRLASSELRSMAEPAYSMNGASRSTVLNALKEVCANRGWDLLAAHVRTNHVHAIVESEGRPEATLNAFKSYASRALNRSGTDEPDRKRWARHGSTRWLWSDQEVRNAIRYVVEEQGEPMAVYLADVI